MFLTMKINNLIRKPIKLWLLLALLCLIFAIILRPTDTLDLAMHDTYIVIQLSHLLFLIAIWLIVGWAFIQFVSAFRMVNWLYYVHVIGTAVTMGICITINIAVRNDACNTCI